jgi:hypothetical protein
MAEKRMFSRRIIGSDAFLDMPAAAQLLYFHLSMTADDDGFVDSTRSVMRSVGANDQDMNALMEKGFIIYFKEEGISLIRHWHVSNIIRKDLYKETKYKGLKSRVFDEDGVYTVRSPNEPVTDSLQNRDEPVTDSLQNRSLDQFSIDQFRSDKEREKGKEGEHPFSLPDELTPCKKDIVAEIEKHRRFWEAIGLPPAQIITNMGVIDSMRDTFLTFSDEKITEAIQNYAKLISLPGFDESVLPGGHRTDFKNFLIRWVDKFIDEAKPFDRFLSKAERAKKADKDHFDKIFNEIEGKCDG